ncbi:MAG: AI-2E family transporter [Ruthenibacterium sp.]
MELNKKNILSILGIVGAAILFYRTLENPQMLFDFFKMLLELVFPLLLGFCIAFVLNVPMRFLERHILQKTQKPLLQKLRRVICILISLIFIVSVLTAVMLLVIPEIVNAIEVLAGAVPDFLSDVQSWAVARASAIPQLKEKIASLQINWADTGASLLAYVTSGAGNFLGSTVNFVFDFAGNLVSIAVGFIFSIYILLSKEKLKAQMQMLLRAILPRTALEKVCYVAKLTGRTFSNFIAGQCMEACILGTLCWLGMLLFRFPYAPMIGALVGLTALIPIVGGFVGTVVGAFMIMMINPMQAIWFIIFLQCLQQIEGNLIYPRVVGSSVGLPPIWVLAAVTLGGSLGGILGMLFAVPVASVLFALTKAGVHEKLKREDA